MRTAAWFRRSAPRLAAPSGSGAARTTPATWRTGPEVRPAVGREPAAHSLRAARRRGRTRAGRPGHRHARGQVPQGGRPRRGHRRPAGVHRVFCESPGVSEHKNLKYMDRPTVHRPASSARPPRWSRMCAGRGGRRQQAVRGPSRSQKTTPAFISERRRRFPPHMTIHTPSTTTSHGSHSLEAASSTFHRSPPSVEPLSLGCRMQLRPRGSSDHRPCRELQLQP